MGEVILAERDDAEPMEIASELGEIWAHSRRAPDKETLNEDALAVLEPGGGRLVLAVADGLGGAPAGGTASSLAVRALSSCLTAPETGSPLLAPIMDAFQSANREILDLGVGAGTTLVAAEWAGGELRTYHVGDSTALLVGQRGRVKLETISHSPVGYGVAAGLIDPADAHTHDDRYYISNQLGATDMHIQVGSPIQMAPRDTLLLASDGIFDNFGPGEIPNLIRCGPLSQVARRLAAECDGRMAAPDGVPPGKPDDASFILFRAIRAARRRGRGSPPRPRACGSPAGRHSQANWAEGGHSPNPDSPQPFTSRSARH